MKLPLRSLRYEIAENLEATEEEELVDLKEEEEADKIELIEDEEHVDVKFEDEVIVLHDNIELLDEKNAID
jgi:hypothetical protein